LLINSLTSEEKKIFGNVDFGVIHDFSGPLSARDPKKAIRTCHDFSLKQRELLLAEKEITFNFRKSAPPKKWWQFNYTDTIEVTGTRKYCAGTQFRDLFCSIPFNEWNSIATSAMKLKLGNEEILSHIEQMHLDTIAVTVSKMNETVKQYHEIVELIFKSGLCRQVC
jgi:hypothetical protein